MTIVELVVDLVVIVVTAVLSIFTGIYDGISYLVAMANGTTDSWTSATGAMWSGVMGFVAEDWVGQAFDWFYADTPVGQWLDNNAGEWFKSNGVVCGVFKGIGEVIGIVVLSIVTFGAATPLCLAVTAAAVGFSKYTGQAWAQMRDSSWEGIERMKENGEISEEQYNSMIMVRNLSDEDWAQVEEDYKNGIIGKDEYEAMKQIRDMPDDWTTAENLFKGMGYGAANGVWEGIQWYVGGYLGAWRRSKFKISNRSDKSRSRYRIQCI